MKTFRIDIMVSPFGRSPRNQLTISHFVKGEYNIGDQTLKDQALAFVNAQRALTYNNWHFMRYKIKQIKQSKNEIVSKSYVSKTLAGKGLLVPAGNVLAPEYTIIINRDGSIDRNGSIHLRGVLADVDVTYNDAGRPTIDPSNVAGKISPRLLAYLNEINDLEAGLTHVIPFNESTKNSVQRDVTALTYLSVEWHKITRTRTTSIAKEIKAANQNLNALKQGAKELLGDLLLGDAPVTILVKLGALALEAKGIYQEIPARYWGRLKGPEVLKALPPAYDPL